MGTFGALSAFSFYPSKNLGCFGDGGAISGTDGDLLDHARLLADRVSGRYRHRRVGTDSRLDSLQAAVLDCRLPRLDEDNRRRRQEIATLYRDHWAMGWRSRLAQRRGRRPRSITS